MADIIKLSTDLLDNSFQDGQANNSITANDIRDLVVSVPFLGVNGWQFYLDGQYTIGARLAISAGVRTQLTIDGTFGILGHPVVTPAAWDVATNKIVPGTLGSFGFARIAITAASVGVSANSFEFELDIESGDFPIIFQETAVFAKGTADQSFNFSIPLFIGPDFLANGGTIFLTPLNDATFYQMGITVVQTYTPYDPTPVA